VSRVIRIAGGQGFWGDSLEAPRQLVEGGAIDYLMLDYLAEVTMSILQKQKDRDPGAGYARDFVGAFESVLPAVLDRGVKVVANAGGVNPRGCAAAVREVAERRGVSDRIRIAVITGDDLLPCLDALLANGHALANMDTGEPLTAIRDRVRAANVYLGSRPIVDALDLGAQLVITGRCTDSALVLAPLRHEFGWGARDYNRLAAGTVAGHIIECGAQCSGGNCLYDWRDIPDLANVGYPIVEGVDDGSFVVTKHPNTGGRVSVASVAEQLLYEMGDPRSYQTPDVVADFTTIRLADDGPDRVRAWGIQGRAPSSTLKVSVAYSAGYKAVGTLVYTWPDALAKAELGGRILRERLDRLGLRFDRVHTEYVGASAAHGPLAGPPPPDMPEVQLRVAVRGGHAADVDRFTREIAPLVLNGPPSVTGYGGARPRVQEIVAFWPALIDRSVVHPVVEIT
jgi:acyclic terpene utilization AtuA family protein